MAKPLSLAPDQVTKRLYIGASLLVPSFIPFTLATMLGSYKALQDAAAEQVSDEAQIRVLFDRWARLNAVRGWLIGGGSFLGIWASLG